MSDEKRTPDRTDVAILDALSKNARLSNKELAALVGLAPSSCLERVRRLMREGVLRGFHADIDAAALGLPLEAMVSVRLRQHTRENYLRFRDYCLTIPEAVAVYHMAGENDFLVHVRARDAQHLRDMAIDRFIARDEVGHIETWLVFEHMRGQSAFVTDAR
jgi:DNA-binding Lrp family transcriptional regulator